MAVVASGLPTGTRVPAFLTLCWLAALAASCSPPTGTVHHEDADVGDGGGDADVDGDADGAVDAEADAEADADEDAGPIVGTCEACVDHAGCGPLSRCIQLTTGDRVCTPTCEPDIPSCPLGFDCIHNFMAPDHTVCVPIGEACCLDDDLDGYGQGIGCAGPDCDETDTNVNPGAPERCNGVDDDCDDEVDDDASDCGDQECEGDLSGLYAETEPGVCVEAECAPRRETACGLYTCGRGAALEGRCAATCLWEDEEDDTLCIRAAHCDLGLCVDDLPNGDPCDEDSDCDSEHCDNGFCCDDGVCCGEVDDCPGAGTITTTCDSTSTCQGTRGEAACVDDQCTTHDGIPDDSACDATIVADDCGYFRSVSCTGGVDQPPPACATSCSDDSACDDDAHCDYSLCLPDLPNGDPCDEDSDCVSAHCRARTCCDAGDCCLSPSDCPASYGTAPTCDTPVSCQGTRDAAVCRDFTCETSLDVGDDSACDTSVVASDCGLYPSVRCTGGVSQPPPLCADSCASDSECDGPAHCDLSACVPDLPDGSPCDEASDCASGHCQNGHCCAAGDCCAAASDCPAAYREPSVCDSASTCQGRRRDAACSSSMCSLGSLVDDDSGCAGLTSNSCGYYPAISCTSATSQPSDQAALCDSSCTTDLECDPGAHCSAGECVADGDPGDPCFSSTECASDLSCVDFVCCTSSCTGTCRACDVAGHEGTCWNVGSGDDPDNECSGFGCAGYYWGWSGDSCRSRATAPDSAVGCDGGGHCQGQATVCPTMGQGSTTLTCNALCQDPRSGTCTGTTAGACDNVTPSPATTTCGTGECQRTVDRCLSGVPQTCVPGSPTIETCDNRDENCNGVIDDSVSGVTDVGEPNNGCTSTTSLGTIAEFNSAQSWYRTIYPDTDPADFYRFYAEEGSHSCFPFTGQDYYVVVTLQPPTGGDCRDYDLYLYNDSCSLLASSIVGGCTADTITYHWDGTCSLDDSRYFRVEVRPFAGYWECRTYTLTIDMHD